MAELQLRNIRKTFSSNLGSRVVIDGIDLNVESGDFIAVLGPSGCGKSTLLKVIAGLVAPDEGDCDLRIDGEAILAPGPDRNIVFQQNNCFPWLSVFQNVQFGLEFRGLQIEERQRRAEHYLRLVELWDYRDEYPKVLSGGQLQRVAIARTLAADPRVILMDEPFAALDAQSREGMQDELLRIHQEARATIVFVTHDISEAAFLANKVYVLSKIPAHIVCQVDARKTRDLIFSAGARAKDELNLTAALTVREQVRYEPRFLDIQRELREALDMSSSE